MFRRAKPYDVKTFWMSVLGIFLLSALMRATGGAGFALMIPIAFFTLARNKPEQLVFVLVLSISTILANGAIMPKDTVYAVSERVLFVGLGFLLMTQVSGHRHPPFLKPLLGLLPYVAYMALVSAMGWSPIISYLKLFLFVSIFMGYYAIAMRSSSRDMDVRKLRAMILAVACYFILGSIVATRFTWAYMSLEELLDVPTDGTNLFKGMASHSNSLGCVLSAFSLVLLCDMLFAVQRPDPLYIANIVVALVFIMRSGSRTSMGSFILAVCFALHCFMKTRSVKNAWRGRVMRWVLLLVALGGAYVLASSSGREKVMRFVVKNRNEDAAVVVTKENILNSRQGKIDEGLENWRESPLFGNGFQVSRDMADFKVSSFKSILSAPVEKSVWFTAVLEEGGVIGFGLFCLFLAIVFPTLVKRKAYIGATLLFSLITANFGEFTFFSLSGAGGMQWGMVFVGFILDGQRLKGEARAFVPSAWRRF